MDDNNSNLPTTAAQQQLAALRAKRELATRNGSSNELALIANHLCACIDTSSSMCAGFPDNIDYYKAQNVDNQRIGAAKAAMRRLVAGSDPAETAFSLVTFDSAVELRVAKTTNYSLLYAVGLEGTGSTRMAEGIELALDQKPSRIILLSDGEPNRRPDDAVARAVRMQIKIDTISIGGADDNLMRWIAEATGGVFMRCDNPEALANHFLQLEPNNYLQIEGK